MHLAPQTQVMCKSTGLSTRVVLGTQYLLWICLHAPERSNEFQGLSSVFAEDQISLPRSSGLKDEKL